MGAVVYTYYKNAFGGRCEKDIFKAYEFDSRQANRSLKEKYACFFCEYAGKSLHNAKKYDTIQRIYVLGV